MQDTTNSPSRDEALRPIYQRVFRKQISAAWQRLATDLRNNVPFVAERVLDWMRQLSNTDQPEDRLTAREMFPMLLLPRWLARTLPEPPGEEFQADLIYSTINGYYFIRLIDNLMDHETTVELEILPAASVFHTQFQSIYQLYFEPGHLFWNEFRRHWFGSAEFAIHDVNLESIDLAQFQSISAMKTCAAKIPLAAVAHRGGQTRSLERWFGFCEILGSFQQMLDDMSDWFRDATRLNITTFFLSEAVRRKRPEESVVSWIAREGFSWGAGLLDGWMAELEESSRRLRSDELTDYLAARKSHLRTWRTGIESSLPGLAELDAIFANAHAELPD